MAEEIKAAPADTPVEGNDNTTKRRQSIPGRSSSIASMRPKDE
jgi:hypothetical protein